MCYSYNLWSLTNKDLTKFFNYSTGKIPKIPKIPKIFKNEFSLISIILQSMILWYCKNDSKEIIG